MSRSRMVMWAVALAALLLGVAAAIGYGFGGVRADCQSWVSSHNYQLVQNDWWAKDRGCVARPAGGDEIVHSESLGPKATGWVWQFAIFVAGASPAIAMAAYSTRR